MVTIARHLVPEMALSAAFSFLLLRPRSLSPLNVRYNVYLFKDPFVF